MAHAASGSVFSSDLNNSTASTTGLESDNGFSPGIKVEGSAFSGALAKGLTDYLITIRRSQRVFAVQAKSGASDLGTTGFTRLPAHDISRNMASHTSYGNATLDELKEAIGGVVSIAKGDWSSNKLSLGLTLAIRCPQRLESYVSDDGELVMEWLINSGRITAVVSNEYAHLMRYENGHQRSKWLELDKLPPQKLPLALEEITKR